MFFVYQLLNHSADIGTKLAYSGDDCNIHTVNGPTSEELGYFTCGDLVFNYGLKFGEVVSIDGRICLDRLEPANINFPLTANKGRLLVGDLSNSEVFAIQELKAVYDLEKGTLHLGNSDSDIHINIFNGVVLGLKEGRISDIFAKIQR